MKIDSDSLMEYLLADLYRLMVSKQGPNLNDEELVREFFANTDWAQELSLDQIVEIAAEVRLKPIRFTDWTQFTDLLIRRLGTVLAPILLENMGVSARAA